MKLQKQLAYKYKNRPYYKYSVVISDESIKKLEWEIGQELEEEVDKPNLILKPISEKRRREKTKSQLRMPYEEFRERIRNALLESPQGLTWSEIRKKEGLPQKVPNNVWVRRLDKDLGLIRKRENRKMIWRLKRVG